ncbi:MAG: chromosome segregation protein SMC [Candidatus Thermoplasmatota archaeon]|nr:chromosome segregation protein SMC [Candidatus Thermoplasmatota archaeon]
MDLYLKEVQMENFKSFGKKTVVPFFPGFTAITGPNGSGKSNIADAILFVLGPKSSKTMRAGRLTDLIFNGGKKQKNPAKYCRVSLVFDNTERKMPIDEAEVILTRMIKRAPLKDDPDNYYSYYYINNSSSNYTEFMNTLLHARISGDGYNIVKQGDVTSIIEMGGIDRRRIIDEISGISTFDIDIKKAEKEKEEVDNNLERITIILKEIDYQIKQLKNDRDEAVRYNELKQQLYMVKAKIALKKKQEIQQQISEIHHQIESYEKEQHDLIEKSNQKKQILVDKQQNLSKIEQEIADVGGDEVTDIKHKIDELRTEIIKLDERINYSNQEIRDLSKDLEKHTTRRNAIDKEIEEITLQKESLDTTIIQLEEKIQEKEETFQTLKETLASSDDTSIELSQQLATLKKEYDLLHSQIHEKKLLDQRLTIQKETLQNTLAELEETKNTYEFEIKDIDWQIQELSVARQEGKKQQKTYEKALFEDKKRESELSEQLHDIDQRIRRLQQQQAKLQAEYDAMNAVAHKYHPAVTELLKARDNGSLKGIHGTIAELANVEDTYKTAMAIAAGGRMQSIIVDDDESASHAIRFLQQKKLGRATFLPLNKMISGKPRGKALLTVKDPHAHGFAMDLVHFQDEYRGAFWYVFGDTIVVDTLEDARRLMGGVRLVDLKGSLIEASGAMVGGSAPRAALMFGDADRTKLDEITSQLQTLFSQQDQIEAEIRTIKASISDCEQKLSSTFLNDSSEKHHQDLILSKKEFTSKHENILHQIVDRNQELIVVQKQLEQHQQDIMDLTEKLTNLENKKDEIGSRLLKGSNKQISQQARQLQDELSIERQQVLEKRSDMDGMVKTIELLTERKDELIEQITQTTQAIQEYKDQITEAHGKKEEYNQKIQALVLVQDKMTDTIKDVTSKRDAIYKETVSFEHELDTINTRIESYYDLVSRAKYRLPTLEDTVKEIDEELKLYKVTLESQKLPPVESLKESLRVIQETMEELEPVNMRALEEYDHQSQRKEKLDEDVKHLKEQRKNLVRLVDEVTKKKTEKFFGVFHDINKNFKDIYARLSEGGEAELQLENEEQIFDSGLTIKARPRGKKVLLLSALSGGEKSIASLALIFAIQQYDPSPFYVLDEVDMFLDGVNAENVSRMIKQNAKDTQFILVSLRKIALKEANHVYGVTMHDNGISDMIGSVDPESVGPQGQLITIGG